MPFLPNKPPGGSSDRRPPGAAGKRPAGASGNRAPGPRAAKPSLVIGRKPLLEALEAGKGMDRIFMQKGATGEGIEEIRRLAATLQVPINTVPVEKLNGFTRANHQGVVAIAALITYMDLQAVIDQTVERGETPLFVMLDGVTDVRNIGAIARSALCCGAQALVIPDKGVGALNGEAMKSSAGALEKINVCRVGSLLKAVDTLHLNGIRVCTAEMNAPVRVFEVDWAVPTCVIMGNEENGVQHFLQKAADVRFTIPMAGGFDSFNVSVAAGIILYEALKHRLYAH
ncbi:MAG TPA: 23S rRNA (guanosine(2251)-2'-O)-methyltransferase RlmB [Dinghuibacter sp.]|uniref:23S rRNA (guanosine(2251)-2'-O)-methyltransferase RlmB n=1 Tax=Dinghuibacter sp. TaxID=2024697 RepID=UPI002C085BC9|nr:23S rRNA (guanosine(2251)-2'-O)-methyltransferase RlmB [Dinghuibacter sp.]HTJ11994.1 23S rRNA (guanosine(2251)-2'-O)-methyltransferase RlmB [Dinghuibacter sp.]